jgi:hypothetical protein
VAISKSKPFTDKASTKEQTTPMIEIDKAFEISN